MTLLHDLEVLSRDDSFDIRFVSEHRAQDIHFVWRGIITGGSDSTIHFGFDGEALSTFERNRIGFCILHPASLAGHLCVVEHTDGTTEPGVFPDKIAPHQPYFDIRAISHHVAPGTQSIVRAGADSLTYFETVGWLGVMERKDGPPLPEQFPSIAGGVFPLYHIFADLADFKGGTAVQIASSLPLHVEGLGLQKGDRVRIMVTNYTHSPQHVTLRGVSGWLQRSVLDETTADLAIQHPETYRSQTGDSIEISDRELILELLPYGVARLDLQKA